MESNFNPHELEPQVQKFWLDNQCFSVSEDYGKPKFYCLSMLPYPSGSLHMGHVRNYTIGDVISRYKKMNGYNVLQPIGWDAFGLPAENAAIKHKVAPAKWTRENIESMRNQLLTLGFAYDWNREFATCDPSYYRWEQWFFLQLFKKKLVYRKNSIVNWDPVDQTVLANEQVVDGRGWRSGALVERREIPQWFIKITAYADELLDDIDKLDQWPEQVRTMQRNWIGRSHGVDVQFKVADSNETLTAFTTRVDTLYGCSFVAIAPEHPLVKRHVDSDPALKEFIESCQHTKQAEADLATQEKIGYALPCNVVHPLTGETLPLYVANFVLMEYGSGVVMAVPGHDERDHEFAKKYDLPIRQVIKPNDDRDIRINEAALTEYGVLQNSGEFDGQSSEQALDTITQKLIANGQGARRTTYRLRDWGVSRQRYWGAPIPIIYCDDCGTVPVPESDLPVVLPEDLAISESGSSLASSPQFYQVNCPQCHNPAKRETDTFDTFIESSWYYARYCCPNQETTMLDDRARYWTPVNHYIGGIEHAVMHLLYARFFHKLLRDEDILNSDEPFKKLLTQGMVLKDGAKMSKSKGNTVDPGTLIEKYGADTVRLFVMFAAPPEQSLEWSDAGVDGAYRFVRKLYSLCVAAQVVIDLNEQSPEKSSKLNWSQASGEICDLRRQIHEHLQQINYDYERDQFNTVVSGAMKCFNVLSKVNELTDPYQAQLLHEGISILLRILNPITPHVTHALWEHLKYPGHIHHAPWPKVAKEALQVSELEFVVQINGKVRTHVCLPAESSESDIEQLVISDDKVQSYLQDKQLKKAIVIKPRRLVNLVVA